VYNHSALGTLSEVV